MEIEKNEQQKGKEKGKQKDNEKIKGERIIKQIQPKEVNMHTEMISDEISKSGQVNIII